MIPEFKVTDSIDPCNSRSLPWMISPDDVSAPNYRSLAKINRWFLVYRDPIIDPDFGEKKIQ
jgi:hypothetical protein